MREEGGEGGKERKGVWENNKSKIAVYTEGGNRERKRDDFREVVFFVWERARDTRGELEGGGEGGIETERAREGDRQREDRKNVTGEKEKGGMEMTTRNQD